MKEIIFFVCSTSWAFRCSPAVTSHFSPIDNPQTMSKKQTEEEKPGEEESVVATSKPMWNLVSKTAGQSPVALGSSASCSPWTLKAQISNPDLTGTGRPMARSLDENTASSSQVWHSDVNTNTSTGEDPWRKRQRNPTQISPQIADIREQCWPS